MDDIYVTKGVDWLDAALTDDDRKIISDMHEYYGKISTHFSFCTGDDAKETDERKVHIDALIKQYGKIGKIMQAYIANESRLVVHPFSTPRSEHRAVSRVIANLRDQETQHAEFVYYTQRAYEMLFRLVFTHEDSRHKNYFLVETAVDKPQRQVAVHNVPDIDEKINNTVMCVMLRGALLPSMILSKEIEEYSSQGYVTPFALFDIKRREDGSELQYALDLKRSYFNLSELQGADLIFADPMNATAGSFTTIMEYLTSQGVRPRRIYFVNVVGSLHGALRVVRNNELVHNYMLWVDPVMNELSYILPGLGDAGDRMNMPDPPGRKRDIIELIADYGSAIANLYRQQIRAIESIVLRR